MTYKTIVIIIQVDISVKYILAMVTISFLDSKGVPIMDINYNHYRIFYYVAKYGNLTQAATALVNSQSNITRTIKLMENELGCTLFVRSNRGVTLTAEGEKLFAHVRIAVEHIQAGEEELSSEKSTLGGTLSIGTSNVALRCFLLPVLKEFRLHNPRVHLRVSNHSTPQAVAALKSGSVDLALVTTPVDEHKSLKFHNVKRVEYVAVCGTAFAQLADRTIRLAELAEYPLISLGAHTKTREVHERWFEEHGLGFTPEIEAYTSDQILPFVKSNLGIGLVPSEIFEDENSEQLIPLQLQESIPARHICFLKRRDQTLSLAAKELERMILQASNG